MAGYFSLMSFISHLCNKVHIVLPILLKLAQIVCIIVMINPIENVENPSNMGIALCNPSLSAASMLSLASQAHSFPQPVCERLS